MSLVAILQLFTFVINTLVLTYIFARFKKSTIGRAWLTIYIVLTVWALADFFTTISTTESMALVWQHVTEALTVPVGALILRFVIIVIYPTFFSSKLRNYLYLLPTFFIALFALTTNFFSDHAGRISWGWEIHHLPLYYILTGLSSVLAMSAVVLTVVSLSKLNSLQRKQMQLFVIGFLFPIVGGTATEIIAPAYGITAPPLTTALFSITGFVMAYAIAKYEILTLSPSLVLDRVFDTLQDVVIVVNLEGKIVLFNHMGKVVTGYEDSEIIDASSDILLHTTDGKTLSPQELFTMEWKDVRMILQKQYQSENIPVVVNGSYIESGGVRQGLVLVARDMTQLDKLVDSLRDHSAEMSESKKQLEIRMKEIERLNEMMVGREVKMAELKKRIKQLETPTN